MSDKNQIIKIIAVEDSIPFAQSLKDIIDMTDGLEWVAHYTHGELLIERLKSDTSSVDMILLDLNLSDESGLKFIPTIKSLCPDLAIVILTQSDDPQNTLEAIHLGVAGYILKDSTLAYLRSAILDIYNGGCVIDPVLSKQVLKALTHQNHIENPLSKREMEVLNLLSLGLVKKEVAQQLGLSYRAVALYTENIYKKLQVQNVAAAIAKAIRKGML